MPPVIHAGDRDEEVPVAGRGKRPLPRPKHNLPEGEPSILKGTVSRDFLINNLFG
jgi:hypothetical protein